MVIKPKVRGFICTNAHPKGCAYGVKQQIKYTQGLGELSNAPKNVLVIGCSTGYGLASRIVTAFAGGAKTLGVCFEKPPTEKKTGTAGWYNTAAFHEEAKNAGLYYKTINGDAFSHQNIVFLIIDSFLIYSKCQFHKIETYNYILVGLFSK